jgi:serine/threonine-protein kinase
MGNVYVCIDKDYQKFALKTYKYASTGGAGDLRQVSERFYQEAVAWVGLGIHPNIVRALTFAKMRDSPFLLLEFVDGGNLRQLMKGGRLDFSSAMKLADNICSGMSFAHSRKIIHRDLKPENILIDNNGVGKVTDFGLARLIEEASGTISQDLRGTLPYMSPEQFLPEPTVDQRADIYSFGVMLYEMLTGKKPFPAETIPQLIAAQREGMPLPPSTHVALPNWMDQLVLRCLEKDPERRFQSFNEILEIIRRSHDHSRTP